MYQNMISQIAPGYDPRLVEAWMRLEYSTLDHLPRATFVREVNIACACIDEDLQASRNLADSIIGPAPVPA